MGWNDEKRLRRGEKVGVGVGVAGKRLVYCVRLLVWEFFRADNKALTNEDSRRRACASVMYAPTTKAPPNEDESQYASHLPRKAFTYIWLHYQTL